MEKENSKKILSAPSPSNSVGKGLGHHSPLRLIIIIISSIFVAEVIAMLVVSRLAPLPYYIVTLTDAGIMLVLIFPILYLFSFQPLIGHIETLRQAEKVLQEKEELNQRFFDSIDTLIAYMDCEFNYIRVNDAFAAEKGQLPEYFIGKNHFVLYPHDQNLRVFEQVVKTGEAHYANESPYEFSDQPERGITYWNWSLQPVTSSEGTVDGVVLSQVDVTERKRAQAEAELERARLRSILDTMPDGVYIVNQQYEVEYVNPVIEREFGPIRAGKCYSNLHNLDGVCDWCKNPLVFQGQSARWEWTSTKTGKTYDVFDTPLLNSSGGLSKLKVLHDITERKSNEEAIRLLSSVVEQTADSVVITNCDGVIEYVNPAFEALTGYQKEEAVHQTPRVLKSGIHNGEFYQKLWGTVLRGQVFQSEMSNRKKNGEIFHEVKTITPLRNEQGDITHFVATGKDITERKQAEEKLRQAFEDLEQRVQDRTQELRIANSELEDEINVRRQAEAALQKSEQRLERAQEIAHLGSWELDLLSNQLTWSDEVYRIFGLQPQEFSATYEAFLEAVHPDDRPAVNEAYFGSIRDFRDVYEIEHRVVKRASGEIRFVHEKCEHFRDESGQIIRSIGMVHDITERKWAQEQIARSNQKLNEILESIQDDFYVLDRNWNFVYASRLFALKVGKEPTEFVGRNIWEMFPKHVGTILEDNFRGAMEKREIQRFELSGKYTNAWYRMTVFPSTEGITVLGTDITERKKAEEALRLAHAELEQRVRERTEELAAANRELSTEISERKDVERQLRIQTAAMEAAANGIMITDLQGTILWTNPAVTQISGYSRQDLIGQSTRLFRSGRQTPDFYEQMWHSILAGDVWQGETMNRRQDGNLYIEEQTITPVRNEDGKLTHFIAIKQDVTERKLIYSQLEESNRELKTLTASERQQRFLAEGLVESSVALNMSLDLHAVLDHIFEQTRRTIPYLAADIVLIDAGVASVVRQWGFDDRFELRTIFEKDNLKLQEFPAWERICQSQSAVLIPDTQLDGQWDTYFGMQWIRSYLGAPLIYNDQVIGIINLISDQENAFHEAMAKNLRAFAAPAAVAIQNARLYETEQQNRKAAELLSAASVALAQTLDIQMVMETILDYVQFILPIDVAFVVLSEGDELYRIRAVRTGNDHNGLRDSLVDQTIDMLNDPIVRSYMTSYEKTSIPDRSEVPAWNPPLGLEFLNCWLGIPLESMGKILGVVVAANTSPNSFTKNQIHLMEAVVKQAVVALQNAWLFDQVRSGRERLQQLSRHLVEIQENERKYIARELHDETSQSLTSLKIGLQVIEQKAAGHQLLLDQISKLKSLADETLESLHRLAVNLRPASLDHLSLVDALAGLIETTRQRSGINAHFKTMGSVQATLLTEELETSVYRIVQESLTNVIRHAHAAHVDIILEWQQEKIVIIIEDDGIGIDMQKARESGHLGLIGMQERAEMLGGKLLVDSTPQVGTTLVVEIPYVHSNTISR